MKNVISKFYCYLKTLFIILILMNIAACGSSAGVWDNLTGPLQPKSEPAVPTLKLNFALPQNSGEDRNQNNIKFKSIGIGACDFSNRCAADN